METASTTDGTAEVINARRTESIDAPHINNLVTEQTDELFGRVNIVNIIEKAILAVTLCNESDEILGHAAFFDYPNTKDVDPASWEEWLLKNYQLKVSNALNTLFMHYFVAKKEYSHGCAEEIIRTVFNTVPDLHFLLLVVPNNVFPESAISDVFTPLDREENCPGGQNNVVFICQRFQHVPVLHIRNAIVEDHDDLTPIFNRHSDVMKKTYGEYFLAELIEAQDEHMQALVAEVNGLAHGFMSISDDVNFDLLNECFELGPFHGLRKPHPDDELKPPRTPTPITPPQKEESATRRSSQSSIKSNVSVKDVTEEPVKSDEGSKEDQTVTQVPSQTQTQAPGQTQAQAPVEEAKEKTDVEKAGSRASSSTSSSRAGSASSLGEVKIKERLSDAQIGGSTSSLLSDVSFVSAVKEAAEQQLLTQDTQQSMISSRSTPKPTQCPSPIKLFIPEYKGEPNAFCIQLFCIDERYEMRSSDFLTEAFSKFPERDFCIISVPHLVPEFPLLQCFVRVTPRCRSTLPHELYVFHRGGLLRDFNVRLVCSKDMEDVTKLVETVDLHENLIRDLEQYHSCRRDSDGTQIQAFVAESSNQIVGVAIIRREENIEYIRSHYNIEDFIYYNHHKREEHAHLHHFALNPVFNHLSKHFLKEILRLGHKTCLYYPLYPSYISKEIVEKHSLVCCLNNLVPVRARRQIQYPVQDLAINAPSERILRPHEPYALNHINRKLALEPKVTINARIVVVGASDVGISYLESLAYCPHLRFNNLSLISPHGMPGEMPSDELREQVLSTSHCYSLEDNAKIALRTWVNVIYGKMTAIDRKKKQVTVNGSMIVPYDHLVLCAGQQYQVPAPTGVDITQNISTEDVIHDPEFPFSGVTPQNLYLVNDAFDAAVALYKADTELKPDKKVVVYGVSLDAYTCLQALLSLGIQGSQIAWVHPPLMYLVTCINNKSVEDCVHQAVRDAGVTIYSNFLLAQFNDGESNCTVIRSASFTSFTDPLRLDCDAFFAFYRKGVDHEAFKAINDACLVYDGKLVIDSSFHTNDVAIRAAGTLTKFKRKYHAEPWTHANFNSKEVGIALASEMLRLFDPTVEGRQTPGEETLNLVPLYRNPKIQAAYLPGGFHYLHVAKPCIAANLEVEMARADYGRELITGELGEKPNYFRLHINQYDTIETITCLSKKAIPTYNIMCLFGVHERYLNNLLQRFDEELIQDFYQFFQESWCLAVYHDRFADFRDEIRELLITSPEASLDALEEKVRQIVDDEITMAPAQRKELYDAYAASGAKRAVETRLLSFINYNHYHLTMYAKPGMV
ncbi:cilia- and flagella-associated protein 61-like isoform X2 [Gigantopelta aegis]|uniref:cilia- and flagella-associated protein 61-like isoform X2 n=1 Tax=Gigantopelta aegis TaxID=1735272 RepID=UPI001B88D9EE|nr:cilia- and flagella-associated protein 61-like isoform X2 [Gigantopelta aegis]